MMVHQTGRYDAPKAGGVPHSPQRVWFGAQSRWTRLVKVTSSVGSQGPGRQDARRSRQKITGWTPHPSTDKIGYQYWNARQSLE
jgi:hypothetical protein